MLVAGLLRIKNFNFQGFTMSQSPQNLPNRTRVLVKDILFQEKYRLTHTQVDIMAYLINALTWATQIGSFFPVTNKKFHKDLPQISEKTLEEALRVLKSMELIEVQMITVPRWKNATVRGISILPKGLEYNASYYKADEKKIIKNMQEEIRELKEQVKHYQATETEEQIVQEAKKEEDIEIDYANLEFTELRETVTKEFGASSEPICNMVNGWAKETTFYINSYNKLTILTPTGNVIQLKNPIEISNFWKYLDKNRDKIGKVIDFNKELSVEELNYRYGGMEVTLQEHKFTVYDIREFKDGVKITIKSSDTNRVSYISNNKEAIVFGLKECEKALLGIKSE